MIKTNFKSIITFEKSQFTRTNALGAYMDGYGWY